jgi:asparagine synthase (glutamine-hydrolysing)
VTVALGGDGGDELLCGYPTALALGPLRVIGRLPGIARTAATRAAAALPASTRYGSPGFLIKQFFRGAMYPTDAAIQIMMGGITPDEQHALVTPVVAEAAGADPYGDVAELMDGAPADDAISRLVYHHSKLYLAGQTLVKMDRATMAHGVEARAPFLDPDLVALTSAMPSSLKLHGFTTKYVLKRALKGLLPDAIIDRRKQGFGVPLAQWLRGPLRPVLEATLHPDRLRPVGLLDPHAVNQLVAEHTSGRRDHRKILWTLLAFERWREAYLPDTTWR